MSTAQSAARAAIPGRLRRLDLVGDPAIRLGVGLVVAMRVALGVVVATTRTSGLAGTFEHQEVMARASAPLAPLYAPWERWDALWYMHIAQSGYAYRGREAAFMPLYPLLIRVLTSVHLEAGVAGLVISTIALALALVRLYRLVARDLSEAVARRAVVATAVFPGALFLYAPYPESLFLLLSVCAVDSARRGRFWRAAGYACLATLCRPQGVLVAVPVAVELVLLWRREGGLTTLRRTVNRVCVILAPVATMAAWYLWVRVALGLPRGPLSVEQSHWGRRFAWPWQSLGDSFNLAVLHWPHHIELLNLLCVVAAIAMLPFMLRRLPLSYTLYAAVSVAVCVFGEVGFTPLESSTRFLAVVFPGFVLVALVRVPAWVRAAAVAGSLAVLVVLLRAYVRFTFVG